ncbi:MAG: lipocalin family protein [Pseudomonadota bacterium]
MAIFDPVQFAGEWYEIASFPVFFQQGCRNTTATYAVQSATNLAVLNECVTADGQEQIAGSAEVVGPGRLVVRLDGVPFGADYWVLWVDQDYQTAVVGVPSGRAGWVLNRAPVISADRLAAAQDVLRFNGYDVSQLVMTQQGAF